MKDFILKGTVIYSDNSRELISMDHAYVVCLDGICKGVYKELPNEYKNLRVMDEGDKLIIPGMIDLHVHAPQYTFRGIEMDHELLDWLDTYTFPEEAKYADLDYARKAYSIFANDLKNSYTTRACVFATLHNEATLELMRQLDDCGLITYVGKVNMDRNGGENLVEESADASYEATLDWLSKCNFMHTYPILTPRFIPACSDELMKKLATLATARELRVQSHLSENPHEIAWVKELVPEATSYGQAYELFNMLGDVMHPAIMAHCVYSDDEELELLKNHGTYVAHCPDSNLNVSSGMAPVRKMLEKGIHVGLGSDVAAGTSLNMCKEISLAIQVSKMYWRYIDRDEPSLTFADAFYLATRGGGSYFGNVGAFEDGYEFDALVIDDSKLKSMRELDGKQRLERAIYQYDMISLTAKYVNGLQII